MLAHGVTSLPLYPSTGLRRINPTTAQRRGLGGNWIFSAQGLTREGVTGAYETRANGPDGGMISFGAAGYWPTAGYVDLTPYAAQAGTGKTWSLWVWPLLAGADENVQTVVSFGAGGSYGPYVSVGGSQLNCYNPTTFVWTKAGVVPTHTATLLTLRFGVASTETFVNGVQVASFAAVTFAGSNCRIGARVDNGATYTGYIQDIRRYDVPLSNAEIWALYAPQTRGDLYRPAAGPRIWDAAAPPAATGNPWYAYAQARA